MSDARQSIFYGQQVEEHDDASRAKRIIPVSSTGTAINPATEEKQDAEITAVKRGLYIPTFDYCAQVQASTTDTWTFKTGGAGGTTVATVVITYTDATKAVISNVAQS